MRETARHRARQVWIEKANESEPLRTCRNRKMTSKAGLEFWSVMSLAGACRLARRCPAWRWRELDLGSGAERGNLRRDTVASEIDEGPLVARASGLSGSNREGLSSDARRRGGPSRGSDEAR